MPLGVDVGLSPGDFVLHGDPVSLPKKGAKPPPKKKKLAHVYCGQTAGCIKMPLGMEVGLRLRDIVFDVDPATILITLQQPKVTYCLLTFRLHIGSLHQD